MSLTVTYKGNEIIDETSDCVKVMKTAGKRMEDDVTIEYSGGEQIEPDFSKVTFWDYDGTLLYQYSLAEIQQLI